MFIRPPEIRVPSEFDGLQVNFCKNPQCRNFGVPASNISTPGQGGDKDRYVLGQSQEGPFLKCSGCNETLPVKSNLAIVEELNRLLEYLEPLPPPSCPNPECSGSDQYINHGKTAHGSTRYRCKTCKTTFSTPLTSIQGQKRSEINKTLMMALVNKVPLRRCCKIARISPGTLYDKIDFFYRQCRLFSGHRERGLANGLQPDRVYLSTDRQDYIVNWDNTKEKRNIVVSAVASVDRLTRYAFGVHTNFDPAVSWAKIAPEVTKNGDAVLWRAYRRYARLRLPLEPVPEPPAEEQPRRRGRPLKADIEARYAEAKRRVDVENSLEEPLITMLPREGMLVHSDCTLYAHFFFLKRLLPNVGKFRFHMDQESGIRAACFAAFHKEVLEKRCDAFYVRIDKELTIHEKQRLLTQSKWELDEFRASDPKYAEMSDNSLRLAYLEEQLSNLVPIGPWRDRWLDYPFPDMAEPRKAVCHLTELGDRAYDLQHLARLYYHSTLRPVDTFFMQIRRALNPLERGIPTSSSGRRIWSQYCPYNPGLVIKLLEIFRTVYNYVEQGEDDKTPAELLGLARGPVDIEDILYFMPKQK